MADLLATPSFHRPSSPARGAFQAIRAKHTLAEGMIKGIPALSCKHDNCEAHGMCDGCSSTPQELQATRRMMESALIARLKLHPRPLSFCGSGSGAEERSSKAGGVVDDGKRAVTRAVRWCEMALARTGEGFGEGW